MPEPDWYRRHYDEAYLRVYAPKLTPEGTALEADRIVALLTLAPGASVLDVACGQGRHSIALAARGFRVTGLDLSPYLLARAREEAGRARVDVRWVEADMREIPFQDEFDAAISVFTSFGYLEDEAQDARVLASIARALRPGGRFLLEAMHRENLLTRLETRGEERRADGTLVTHERNFDTATSRLEDHAIVLAPSGERWERTTSIRLYTVDELRRMFASAGLRVDAAFGRLDGSPLTAASRRLAILAMRA